MPKKRGSSGFSKEPPLRPPEGVALKRATPRKEVDEKGSNCEVSLAYNLIPHRGMSRTKPFPFIHILIHAVKSGKIRNGKFTVKT